MSSFKFGKPTTDAYGTRRGQALGSVQTQSARAASKMVLADSADVPFAGTSNYGNSRFNPVFDRLETGSIWEDWLPRDASGLNLMFRRIHLRDAIAGPTVDIYASMPWSEFDVTGVKDPAMRRFYEEAFAMYTPEVLTTIAKEFLVIGRYCASLQYNQSKGFWDDFAFHDPDMLTIQPVPARGWDPLIDIQVHPAMKAFLNSQDERVRRIRATMPKSYLDKFKNSGRIPLDQFNTQFLARQVGAGDTVGTSMLSRVCALWAIEKALMDATVTAARRRTGNILHISAGIDGVWEPDDNELDNISSLFVQAEEDPVGAVVATRSGVTVQEVRQGGQIWKISDEWAFLAEAKMRALGVSEAFLAGDACMVGDTLVPTVERGLVRIGELGSKKTGPWNDIDLTVGSRYGTAKAAKWLYNGVKPTLKITSDSGYPTQCTFNHPVLVFTGMETEWRRADQLRVGDKLCLSTQRVVRSTPLKLDLTNPTNVVHGGQRKSVTKPLEMTPDLAYLLGLIVSEGSIQKKASQLRFCNTDMKLLERFSDLTESVFGVSGNVRLAYDPVKENGSSRKIHGTVPCYETILCSKTVVEWLEQLGCYAGGNKNGKRASHYKHVPWSVLEADEQSQLAFMAAYIEGDGSTVGKSVVIISSSQCLLTEMQALFATHGVASRRYRERIQLYGRDCAELWPSIKHYMVSKEFTIGSSYKARNSFGVDVDQWRSLIDERKRRSDNKGIVFINDSGVETRVRGWNNWAASDKKFLYDKYVRGDYDQFLEHLKEISTSSHAKLVSLLDARHRFSEIVSITDGGKQDVFDVSMASGEEPAFVANGVVCHNTFSNMETARSILMEQITVFREQLTKQIFHKTAITLARAHGFVKDDKRAANRGQIRIGDKGRLDPEVTSGFQISRERRAMLRASPYGRDIVLAAEANDEDFKRRLRTSHMSMEKALRIPADSLITPSIHWRKEMKPSQDQAYIDLLSTIEEKGLPVPKRIWAAAAGYDLDAAIEMMPEDKKLSRMLAKEMAEEEEAAPPEEGLKTPPGEGMDKLDKLMEEDKGKRASEEGGGGEVSPEKPPAPEKPKTNPATNPAKPSEMKPQRNPLAFVQTLASSKLWRGDKFAGLRRDNALTMASKVEANFGSVVDDGDELRALICANVQKPQSREVAAFVCYASGLPKAMTITEATGSLIAKALVEAKMDFRQTAQYMQRLSVMVSDVQFDAREVIQASSMAAAKINGTAAGKMAEADLKTPATSRDLLSGKPQ